VRGLNLNQIRTFLDVVELGSFSAAADRVGLSQPAVSLQVRELERYLNVKLLERVGKRARPTPAGESFIMFAHEFDQLSARLESEMARFAEGALGKVRIGTGATACIYLMPPVLKQLRERFPKLEITVETGNTQSFVKAIEENVIDLALVTLPVASRTIEVIPILVDEFMVIAPVDMDMPTKVDPSFLRGRPLILFEPEGSTRHIADRWLSAHGGEKVEPPAMSLGSVEAIKEMVRAGLGCAIVPGLSIRDHSAAHGLQVRPLVPRLYRSLGLILRRDKPLHRGLRETINAFKTLQEQLPTS